MTEPELSPKRHARMKWATPDGWRMLCACGWQQEAWVSNEEMEHNYDKHLVGAKWVPQADYDMFMAAMALKKTLRGE